MTEHTKISYVKSGIRIAGYALLLVNLAVGVIVLILSEMVGIAEEMVGA